MHKAIFITGTDTGVGKTIICGLLARHLALKGKQVITQKWIQTGCTGFSEDIRIHDKIIGDLAVKGYSELRCPYLFKAAVSPHLAARLENRRISPQRIKSSFKLLACKFDYLIVEGAGGLLVPFNRNSLMIDIVRELNLPILLVAENRLGAINHTLLSIETVLSRKLKLLGIVFNNAKYQQPLVLQDNPQIIRAVAKARIFGTLPRAENLPRLSENFAPIGEKICQAIK
ncbi:MAG: dethiobiotin synthase [Candidatus Omnitrophica bacterium]|nr:dethiobiotin synthase [Candidatus Omnitrophota bacterium]MDD5653912.1 dethiobiotin synthase [Candidatus Omnitrophota bacterium]